MPLAGPADSTNGGRGGERGREQPFQGSLQHYASSGAAWAGVESCSRDNNFHLLLTPSFAPASAAGVALAAAPVEVASRDLGSGRHLLTYRATVAGVYRLQVFTESGTPVTESGLPLPIRIEPAEAHAASCAVVPAEALLVDANSEHAGWRATVGVRATVMLQVQASKKKKKKTNNQPTNQPKPK
ncbi:hypothetical protein T492DRAFT_169103 [Pavlovales sp. CCMP2436]|nr:hypothetical protein T492DRAFT_169103 [Pavlovales sp. CCMP2436]